MAGGNPGAAEIDGNLTLAVAKANARSHCWANLVSAPDALGPVVSEYRYRVPSTASSATRYAKGIYGTVLPGVVES